MRPALAALFALAIHVALVTPGSAADVEFNSAYAGESAFLHIGPSDPGNFQVFFINTGRATWVRGTPTQVDLAVCLEDKISCNVSDPKEAGWRFGWLSATRYASHVQASVAPGGIATFSYHVKAPVDDPGGLHRFNGDLVVTTSGQRIHPEGYYQDAYLEFIRGTP